MKKMVWIWITLLFSHNSIAQENAYKEEIQDLLQNGMYKEALKRLDGASASFTVLRQKAEIYEKIDEYQKAIFWCEKALQLNEDIVLKNRLARLYKTIGQNYKAISIYESLLAKDPDNSLAAYQLAKLLLQVKKPNKAIPLLQELQKVDTENANYFYHEGIANTMLKNKNKAIDNFLQAYRKNDAHFKAIERLAYAYVLLQDKDSTALFVNRGLELRPEHIAMNKIKINALYRDKKYAKAEQLLQKMDTITPNAIYVKKMLGRTCLKLKEYQKAKQYFQQAQKLDRTDYKIYTYLGDIAYEEQMFKDASLHYMMATFIGKDKRDTEYYQLARTQEKLEKPKAALKSYASAMQENRNNYRALYQLANLSENIYEDKTIALRHYQKYLERFKSSDPVLTKAVDERIKEIKKFYFKKGISLE